MSAAPIRLLLVDDHAIVRRGMKALLTKIEEMAVIGRRAMVPRRLHTRRCNPMSSSWT
ncbi:MAG: hypothetical protein R2932_42260 [Caldilineaceae bacterium]